VSAGTPEPSVRSAFLLVALLFCLAFGGMTAIVAAQSGIDILTLTAFLIVVMIMLAVLGALRNPPGD
jgi:Na+(H+)/acetate symporter ActP